MRNPRDFAKPLAVGAPDPILDIPVTPSRMIHFFDPSNEKIVGKLPDLAQKADILLGNLEDAISVENKEAARAGLVRVGKYVDRLLAQLEARAGLDRPLLVHAILETSLGVANLEEIAQASPRMQGMSFGPADLAASRRMKTTRVGGGHPGYRVIEDPDAENAEAPRADYQQ